MAAWWTVFVAMLLGAVAAAQTSRATDRPTGGWIKAIDGSRITLALPVAPAEGPAEATITVDDQTRIQSTRAAGDRALRMEDLKVEQFISVGWEEERVALIRVQRAAVFRMGVDGRPATRPLAAPAPFAGIIRELTGDAVTIQLFAAAPVHKRFVLRDTKVFTPDVIAERVLDDGRYVPAWQPLPGALADLHAGDEVSIVPDGERAAVISVVPPGGGHQPATRPSLLAGTIIAADATSLTVELRSSRAGDPPERRTYELRDTRFVLNHQTHTGVDNGGRNIRRVRMSPGELADLKPGRNVQVYIDGAIARRVAIEVDE